MVFLTRMGGLGFLGQGGTCPAGAAGRHSAWPGGKIFLEGCASERGAGVGRPGLRRRGVVAELRARDAQAPAARRAGREADADGARRGHRCINSVGVPLARPPEFGGAGLAPRFAGLLARAGRRLAPLPRWCRQRLGAQLVVVLHHGHLGRVARTPVPGHGVDELRRGLGLAGRRRRRHGRRLGREERAGVAEEGVLRAVEEGPASRGVTIARAGRACRSQTDTGPRRPASTLAISSPHAGASNMGSSKMACARAYLERALFERGGCPTSQESMVPAAAGVLATDRTRRATSRAHGSSESTRDEQRSAERQTRARRGS